MLSSKHRVPRQLFPSLSRGRAFSNDLFSLKYTKKSDTISRFSVVASKKVAKTAVSRNRIKRKMYSVLEKLNIESVSGIFYVKKDAINATFVDLLREIKDCFNKI